MTPARVLDRGTIHPPLTRVKLRTEPWLVPDHKAQTLELVNKTEAKAKILIDNATFYVILYGELFQYWPDRVAGVGCRSLLMEALGFRRQRHPIEIDGQIWEWPDEPQPVKPTLSDSRYLLELGGTFRDRFLDDDWDED